MSTLQMNFTLSEANRGHRAHLFVIASTNLALEGNPQILNLGDHYSVGTSFDRHQNHTGMVQIRHKSRTTRVKSHAHDEFFKLAGSARR